MTTDPNLRLKPYDTEQQFEDLTLDQVRETDSNRAHDMDRELLGDGALFKSTWDRPFFYLLKLRTGELVWFSGSQVVNREWIHVELTPGSNDLSLPPDTGRYRGMDIHISDIVWVMDAPRGS